MLTNILFPPPFPQRENLGRPPLSLSLRPVASKRARETENPYEYIRPPPPRDVPTPPSISCASAIPSVCTSSPHPPSEIDEQSQRLPYPLPQAHDMAPASVSLWLVRLTPCVKRRERERERERERFLEGCRGMHAAHMSCEASGRPIQASMPLYLPHSQERRPPELPNLTLPVPPTLPASH
ncbi:hypothetical protein GOP47_0019261 [Adiantum capillus-veneris]|uniref:Uncharacterized protein n=1 Tax=Adiantum capillus-veneris TaxID=13818 RepID=A0A9D4ZAC3_ADICA|nr:hypothetical protein GOP47_0019261 [Adiantum capillus-veneris]